MCRKRFLYLILAFMVLLNALLLAFAWQVVSGRRARAEAGADSATAGQPTGEPGSALAAYQYAEPVAVSWAPDALLLRARGDWPEGSFSAGLENWTFVFYSEALGAIAQINVRGDGAQLLSSGAANQSITPVPLSDWQIDSDAIVEALLSGAGGDLFLQERNHVSMVLSLNLGETATWTATLVDWETGELLRRDFDARNGYLIAGL